jgi:anti-anti-sigma factor
MMESTVTRDGTTAVLQAGGDLVSTTVPGLRPVLRDLLQDGVRELVLDLSEARMVDSSGIGLLMAAHNSLEKVGGTLTVVHASPEIRELFTAMRLNQHLTVADD